VDVTGGIFLKLESAAMIAQNVEHVWFLDGRKTERVMQLMAEGVTRGTRIML
jgi:isopentenyl phosphate kinase